MVSSASAAVVALGLLATSVLSAASLLRSERVTGLRRLGVLIGFSGVLLIARPWATTTGDVDMTGLLYMLIGSASVGLSFVYAKRFLTDLEIPPEALTTYQIGLALLTLAIGWLLVDEPLSIFDGAAVLLILTGVVVLGLKPSQPMTV